MHLLKCAIGTGILFLPHAFRKTGYAMSIVCGIVIGTLCIHTAVVIVRENVASENFFFSNIITSVWKTKTISEKRKRRLSFVYITCPYIVMTQLFANQRYRWDKTIKHREKGRSWSRKAHPNACRFFFSFSLSFSVYRCNAPRCYADAIACPCWTLPKRRSSPSRRVRRGFESTPGYSA